MPLEARVKSVLSGDTVVLSHVTNPGQERVLSLAYVSAPRLRREGDEVSPDLSRRLKQPLKGYLAVGNNIMFMFSAFFSFLSFVFPGIFAISSSYHCYISCNTIFTDVFRFCSLTPSNPVNFSASFSLER